MRRQCARAIEDVIRSPRPMTWLHSSPSRSWAKVELSSAANYFQEVKKVLDRHGNPLIADEVQSGFARTGKMFAIEHYGVDRTLWDCEGYCRWFPAKRFYYPDRNCRCLQAGDHLSTFGG